MLATSSHLIEIPADLVDRLDERTVGALQSAPGLDFGIVWLALHWVLDGGGLTGVSAVFGGTELPFCDPTDGAPEFLTPAEVVERARELDRCTDDTIRALHDISAMERAGVVFSPYPSLDELHRLTAQVRAFYRTAIAHGAGILMFHS